MSSLSLAMYQIVFARGRLYTAALSGGTKALLHITLVAAMGWWLGLAGVALAGVVGLAASGWWILWRRYCQDFNVPWMEALHQMLPLALVGIGILGIGIFLRQLAPPTTVMGFLFHCGGYLGAAAVWVVLVDRRMRGLFVAICRSRPLA